VGTTDNPAPVIMKVYKVHSAFWDKFIVVDHYDDAIECVRELLETALENGDNENETVRITIEKMSEDDYKAIPELVQLSLGCYSPKDSLYFLSNNLAGASIWPIRTLKRLKYGTQYGNGGDLFHADGWRWWICF